MTVAPRLRPWLAGALRRFRAATRGGVATLTALALPPILLIGLGAVELQQVISDKAQTQDAADAAALFGAQQLSVTQAGAADRTKAFALAQLTDMSARSTVTVTATAVDTQTMKVAVDTARMSFFMNLLPPGGFHTHAEATAVGEGVSPLCVLVIGSSSSDDILLYDSSRMQAPQCLVHSNQNIQVNTSAQLQGQLVEAVNSASGPINPAASTGAKTVANPFAGLDIDAEQPNFPETCPSYGGLADVDIWWNWTLQPGIHPFDYRVTNGATLTLAPGAHYFCGDVELKNHANLLGNGGVVLIFNRYAQLDTHDGANVSLNGRKSGPLAGFVLIVNDNYTSDFNLNSDPISNITGTIYSPTVTLAIDGSETAGNSSPWTILAAKKLKLIHSPLLVINANYGGTDVPVPDYQVGNKTNGSRLTN